MGNCSPKISSTSSHKAKPVIRIVTGSGRVIMIDGPKLAQEVLDDHPGYGIYQKGNNLTLPLFEDEVLVNGGVYYLLPFGVASSKSMEMNRAECDESLSFRKDQNSAFEVLPSKGNGVWRVKMAIDSKELEEMLAENAEDLIQMMRSAAKSSEKSVERSFRWPSMGFKSPGTPRRFAAC